MDVQSYDRAPLPPALARAAGACEALSAQPHRLDAETIRRDLARRIREWRQQADWPLDAMALKLGVSPSTINLWENAKRFPNLDNLVALASLIGERPCELICPDHACRLAEAGASVAC